MPALLPTSFFYPGSVRLHHPFWQAIPLAIPIWTILQWADLVLQVLLERAQTGILEVPCVKKPRTILRGSFTEPPCLTGNSQAGFGRRPSTGPRLKRQDVQNATVPRSDHDTNDDESAAIP